MSDAPAALEVFGVTYAYGRAQVLRGIDLHVDQGEIVTIIGPNGAGKSTLLNVVARALRLQAGTVRLQGRDTGRDNLQQVVRAGCLLVPEGRQVFASMSVEHNLLLGGHARPRGVSDEGERVLDLFPELSGRLGQAAGTLSGGEQQMLAIGRAMMGRPTVMLLDEPSLGLSPQLVQRIMTALGRLRREGLTIMLVEQNVSAALQLSDRAYLVGGGTVITTGTSDDVAVDPTVRAVYLGGAVAGSG